MALYENSYLDEMIDCVEKQCNPQDAEIIKTRMLKDEKNYEDLENYSCEQNAEIKDLILDLKRIGRDISKVRKWLDLLEFETLGQAEDTAEDTIDLVDEITADITNIINGR